VKLVRLATAVASRPAVTCHATRQPAAACLEPAARRARHSCWAVAGMST
jgi:hypothetical protein